MFYSKLCIFVIRKRVIIETERYILENCSILSVYVVVIMTRRRLRIIFISSPRDRYQRIQSASNRYVKTNGRTRVIITRRVVTVRRIDIRTAFI